MKHLRTFEGHSLPNDDTKVSKMSRAELIKNLEQYMEYAIEDFWEGTPIKELRTTLLYATENGELPD